LDIPIQLLQNLETACNKLQQQLRWLEERSTPAKPPHAEKSTDADWVDDSKVSGLQIGEVRHRQAVVWVRTPAAASLLLLWSTHPDFFNAQQMVMPDAVIERDFTSRLILQDLPAGQHIYVRVLGKCANQPWQCEGRFKAAPAGKEPIRFAWSADVCGQGWGINKERGGLLIFKTLRSRQLDFFVHCGDNIYADHPLATEVPDEAGKPWRNVVTAAKSHVAQTLEDFHGNYRYNWLDDEFGKFCAEVPLLAIWDDHEVVNNWSPGLDLAADTRYQTPLPLLACNARRAFGNYLPLEPTHANPTAPLYRSLRYGPQLELFMLDMQLYRGPNDYNLQSDGADLLGATQLAWLQQALEQSDALWKVIVAGMPVGLNIPDGLDAEGRIRWQGMANGDDGPPRGRECELAELLSFIKRKQILNTVWLCADVHYTAAHYYEPTMANFKDFLPFWEFVSGPMHAGSYGPLSADGTFGLQTVFSRASPLRGACPSAGYQFFGEVEINSQGEMMVTLLDGNATPLFRQQLQPQ
jgi:alkaline phosphatase D